MIVFRLYDFRLLGNQILNFFSGKNITFYIAGLSTKFEYIARNISPGVTDTIMVTEWELCVTVNDGI